LAMMRECGCGCVEVASRWPPTPRLSRPWSHDAPPPSHLHMQVRLFVSFSDLLSRSRDYPLSGWRCTFVSPFVAWRSTANVFLGAFMHAALYPDHSCLTPVGSPGTRSYRARISPLCTSTTQFQPTNLVLCAPASNQPTNQPPLRLPLSLSPLSCRIFCARFTPPRDSRGWDHVGMLCQRVCDFVLRE
jgi:hypothetical protein